MTGISWGLCLELHLQGSDGPVFGRRPADIQSKSVNNHLRTGWLPSRREPQDVNSSLMKTWKRGSKRCKLHGPQGALRNGANVWAWCRLESRGRGGTAATPSQHYQRPSSSGFFLPSWSSIACLLFFIQSESTNGKGNLPATSALPALLEK